MKLAGGLPAVCAACSLLLLFVYSAISNPTVENNSVRLLFAEAVEQGNFAQARVAMGALLTEDPHNSEFLYQLAMLELKLGNVQQCREQLEELCLEHQHALAAMWLISQDFDLGKISDWSQADHRRFRSLIEIGLSESQGRNLLSTRLVMVNYLLATANPGEALRFYDTIIEDDPAQALAGLAIAKQQHDEDRAKRFARIAKTTFETQLKRSPSDTGNRIALAQSFLLDGEPKQAAQLLNDGFRLSQDPKLAHSLGGALLAWAQSLESKPESTLKRLQILNTAIRISPQDHSIAFALVQVLMQCRDHADSQLRGLRDRILRSPGQQDTELVRGTVALLENRFSDALEYFEKASATNPNLPAILNNLAVAISKTPGANLEHALYLVNESLQSEPLHPYFRETRGSILLRLSRWKEAIEDLELALAAPELEPLVRPSLALAYQKVTRATPRTKQPL